MTHRLLRRIFVFIVISSTTIPLLHADSEDELPPVTIIAARDLQADAQLAQQRGLPILLYFASDYCGYCRYVEEAQIKPMLRNRDYDAKVMVRRVNLSNARELIFVNGIRLSADQLASLYQAPLTPTLIFINAEGKEIAPRLVGVGSEDYYGGDLDNSIATALQHLRAVASNQATPH
jgi:thioredoxin-related protein